MMLFWSENRSGCSIGNVVKIGGCVKWHCSSVIVYLGWIKSTVVNLAG